MTNIANLTQFATRSTSTPSIVINNKGRSILNSPELIQFLREKSIDVTDNKMITLALNKESERLNTFTHKWTLYCTMDKNILARIGMYYTGDEDKVKCYFCEVVIGRWESNDDALLEHIRWSPNCPLLKRRTTNNEPIDPELLDTLLPPVGYDVCGANDIVEYRPSSYSEGTISSSSESNNMDFSIPSSCNYLFPDHPEYAIESARLRSYQDWPRTMKQKPEQLSEAGFFYTGIGDRVKCFSCGGGLKDWDDSDDPWEQHALWLSNCSYLKLMKGLSFIDHVKQKCNKNACNENECANKRTLTLSSSSSSSSSSGVSTSSSSSLSKESTSTSMQSELTSSNGSIEASSDDDNLNKSSNINSNSNSCNHSESHSNDDDENNEIINCKKCTISCGINGDQQKLKKQISEEKLCKICYTNEYNTAFLPCGHVIACAKCASSVTKCPMCRKPFTNITRIFFP